MKRLKAIMVDFLKKRPGRRFLYAYLKINALINHNLFIKLIFATIGSLLLLFGIILLFIPGPGIPFVLIGALLCCIISKKFAYRLDQLEKHGHNIREKWNKRKSNNKDTKR